MYGISSTESTISFVSSSYWKSCTTNSQSAVTAIKLSWTATALPKRIPRLATPSEGGHAVDSILPTRDHVDVEPPSLSSSSSSLSFVLRNTYAAPRSSRSPGAPITISGFSSVPPISTSHPNLSSRSIRPSSRPFGVNSTTFSHRPPPPPPEFSSFRSYTKTPPTPCSTPDIWYGTPTAATFPLSATEGVLLFDDSSPGGERLLNWNRFVKVHTLNPKRAAEGSNE
mmetsp:Transcript_4319/g.8012  ORF Transcript_4319/g.8012 Transcript_4319/m.8012 type:complete len:226 (+) Transcript_4319:1430-2107(+)